MKWFEENAFWGILLVLAGILFLLRNQGFFLGRDMLWAFSLGIGGALFLATFAANRAKWWALIPGLTLVGLAASIALGQIAPEVANLDVSLFLGSMGLSFWAVYLVDRHQWWAIVPGGVILSLAVVTGLEPALEGGELGGIFFLGLGITFGLLALLPIPDGQARWALVPAAVLGVMGVLLLASFATVLSYFWPAVLILSGLYLLTRALQQRMGSS